MSRELKKYGIRATKKPARSLLVSSVCLVRNEKDETGYCYINFDQPFVEAVGKALPRGVSEHSPAVISVVFYPRTMSWLVQAGYVGSGTPVLLWKSANRPAWLNFYRMSNKNAYHPEKAS